MSAHKLLNQLRYGLASTVRKLRDEIDELQAKGGIPADYSLGFTNAIIFCEHRIAGRAGEPDFYDRTTSDGKLVKPIALERGEEVWLDPAYRQRVDAVLGNAAQLLEISDHNSKRHDDPADIKPVHNMVDAVSGLIEAQRELEQFLDGVGSEKGPESPSKEADERVQPSSPAPAPVEVSEAANGQG